jgi:signal peptidase I
MSVINWLLHKSVRQASEMKSQVRMLLNEQRDLLATDKIANLEAAVASMESAIRANPGEKALAEEMDKLEKVANKNLIPYGSAAIRENVKEILVALVTIMAFTTFFLQLTKIPTGSMQPTLYGITDENLLDQNPAEKIPGFLARVKDYWVWGFQYNWFVAPVDGEFESYEPVKTVLPFIKKQQFKFAGEWHTIWFPGDGLFGASETGHGDRAVIRHGTVKKGEYVFAMKIIAGDHLLVDRISYNFRHPNRGEIVVFKTRGIQGLPQDQLYIKRLVGLSGEKIQIGDDQHLIVNGRPVTAANRHFEMVYSFDNSKDPVATAKTPEAVREAYFATLNRPPYRGHVNQRIASDVFHFGGMLAPYFPDQNAVFQVGPDRYLPMGDNQLNSQDGRYFGDFDRKNLIGKCWFVYWPFTDRFGWAYR